MARTDKAQFELRVQRVLQLMLGGIPSAEVVRIVTQSEKGEFAAWGVKRRTAQRYIAAARARIRASAEIDRQGMVGLCRERLENLYLRLYEKKDFRGCARVVQQITDLFGLSYKEELLDRLEALEQSANRNPHHEEE